MFYKSCKTVSSVNTFYSRDGYVISLAYERALQSGKSLGQAFSKLSFLAAASKFDLDGAKSFKLVLYFFYNAVFH